MRKLLTAFFLVIAAVVGYAVALPAQSAFIPFVAGRHIMLYFEGGRQVERCTVELMQDNFVGCTTPRMAGREERVIWYNLRFVTRVEPQSDR